MDPRAATEEFSGKDPNLPPMVKVGDIVCPAAPTDKEAVGAEFAELLDLALKLAATVARYSTDWAAQQLHLSLPLARQVLEKLAQEGLTEELWQTGQGSSHYRITQQGRDHSVRLMDSCGYVGPAPVTLEAYSAMLSWQFANTQKIQPEDVTKALSGLVLTKKAAQLAGLAVSSGRSLFVYGPSGNGKSSIGRQIQAALPGDYWIPYALTVGTSIIRVYDDHCHDKVEVPTKRPDVIDNRWIRIRRPLVIVGGELTLDLLDLIYSPAFRFYEAPPHLKANGGVFLVDDFGRERVSPDQLLNRFITPMEHQIDYFTLRTGQKIQLPLKHVLIIATNLSPETVTDPAFLRRMGYRLYLGPPSTEQYTKIFNNYAQKIGATIAPDLIEKLLDKYREQDRELRCCEPRDLIERCKDICRFHNRPLELSPKIMEVAWTGYFGEQLPTKRSAPPLPETAAEKEEAAVA